MSVCLSVCLSVCQSICLSLCLCLPIYHLSVCLYVYLYGYPFVCLSEYPSVFLSVSNVSVSLFVIELVCFFIALQMRNCWENLSSRNMTQTSSFWTSIHCVSVHSTLCQTHTILWVSVHNQNISICFYIRRSLFWYFRLFCLIFSLFIFVLLLCCLFFPLSIILRLPFKLIVSSQSSYFKTNTTLTVPLKFCPPLWEPVGIPNPVFSCPRRSSSLIAVPWVFAVHWPWSLT